jgi:opacity protein-like surface antigen
VKRILFSIVLIVVITTNASAQSNGYFHQGEFGFTVGMGHYFGDLNTRTGLNVPKPSAGLFFRKQFGNYVGLRVAGRFAQLEYSDKYSKNDYQKTRNLSFNSNIFEFAIQGDFNFFEYNPYDVNHIFTPYVTLGVGLFSYDPYTIYNGEKVYLRPLGTEGQVAGYLGRTEYSTMAVAIPLGVGIKYSINPKVNLTVEVSHRFTTTDYLDDVSTTYVNDPSATFPTSSPTGEPTLGFLLNDRSWEVLGTGVPLLGSVPGRQRGWSKQKDQYVIAEIGISFNIGSYRCPTAN